MMASHRKSSVRIAGRKNIWVRTSLPGRSFLLVHHLVDVLGGFRRDHLQHRPAHGANG